MTAQEFGRLSAARYGEDNDRCSAQPRRWIEAQSLRGVTIKPGFGQMLSTIQDAVMGRRAHQALRLR